MEGLWKHGVSDERKHSPPASASQKIATKDSGLEMNAFPTAAASIPATSTVDQSPKIFFWFEPRARQHRGAGCRFGNSSEKHA
jgi:hypothetical protein